MLDTSKNTELNVIKSSLELLDNTNKNKSLYSVEKRIQLLKSLKSTIEEYSDEICEALKKDLGKGEFEAYLGEIDYVTHEIDVMLKKLRKWAKPKRVSSSLVFFPVKSYIYKEPYGKVLIIGPWNYPFQLVMAPLVGAIAAGNTVVLKPSEISDNTSLVIHKVVQKAFDRSEVITVLGGVEETTYLLDQKFDYIFYTGNGMVGRIVMEKASKNLTPVTLELGGKSPCMIYADESDLSIAAKRTMWGKFFNAGQTCVAPDYVLIPKGKKDAFINYCKHWLNHFYGKNISKSEDFGRIINSRHFLRLKTYLEDGVEILLGGELDDSNNYIEPTLVSATLESKIMNEEIFGPILPIIECEDLDEAIEFVNERYKPLACYAFVDSSANGEKVIREVSSGGMVINDTLVHLSNENLPFGGVGESGMGAYHGEHSFSLFSHSKSVMKRSFAFENSLRYPPYKGKLDLLRKILSLLG